MGSENGIANNKFMYIQVEKLRHRKPATTGSSTSAEKPTIVQIPKIFSATCAFASAGCGW